MPHTDTVTQRTTTVMIVIVSVAPPGCNRMVRDRDVPSSGMIFPASIHRGNSVSERTTTVHHYTAARAELEA